MKIYGNDKTHLTLSNKAQSAYDFTVPLRIEEIETNDGYTYNISGCLERYGMNEDDVNQVLEEMYDELYLDEYIEEEEYAEEEDTILQISKIAIKSETFCTTWNNKLYCVDICEDAAERSAWLYNANYGVKSLMWGEEIDQQSRESFLDLVFSNLPDYIGDYEEEYEDQ